MPNPRSFVVALLLLAVAGVTACNGPLPFLSGGRLDGEPGTVPAQWDLGDDYGVMQLETRPEDPYSVNLAYSILDGAFYVYAGDTETEWVKHMQADPRVRVRHDGVLYDLHAQRVTDAAENAAFAEFWAQASVFHRDPTELTDETWLYRLERRP